MIGTVVLAHPLLRNMVLSELVVRSLIFKVIHKFLDSVDMGNQLVNHFNPAFLGVHPLHRLLERELMTNIV